MKKNLAVILALCLCLLMSAALAEGVSLEEALAMVGQPGCPELIALDDHMAHLELLSSPDYTLNEGKFIVVMREAPLKKYESRQEPYDADYAGVDDGTAKAYLHAGIMQTIPEERRAATVEEIGNVLMAETMYYISGQITTSENVPEPETASDQVLALLMEGKTDEAQAMQEMQAQQEEKEGENYRYVPVYDGVYMVNLYNWADGSSLNMDVAAAPSPEMRANPEADDYWDMILEAIDIARYAVQGDVEGAAAYIINESAYMETEVLAGMLEMDAQGIYAACEEAIWKYAALMAAADGDKDTMEQYAKVINARNLSALAYIAQTRAYNSVSDSDFIIEYGKKYTAQTDPSELEAMLEADAALLAGEQISWNPFIIYLITMLGSE